MSIQDERKMRLFFEDNRMICDPKNKEIFDLAVEAYKNFDFSQLKFLDEKELLFQAREAFDADEELSSRPILFHMYIFYRNGYLDRDRKKIDNHEFEIDLTNIDIGFVSGKDIPQGLITEDGVCHACGIDGHAWLYYYLNLSGQNTNDVVRFLKWHNPDDEADRVREKFLHFEKHDYDKSYVYLSDKQAIAINNLRKINEPFLPLQRFLRERTENMGFAEGESRKVFDCNFDTFYKALPNEPLDKEEFQDQKYFDDYVSNYFDRINRDGRR